MKAMFFPFWTSVFQGRIFQKYHVTENTLYLKDISVIGAGFLLQWRALWGFMVETTLCWSGMGWFPEKAHTKIPSNFNHSIQTSGLNAPSHPMWEETKLHSLFSAHVGKRKLNTGKGMKNGTEAEDFFFLLSILPGNLLAFLGFECLSWAPARHSFGNLRSSADLQWFS